MKRIFGLYISCLALLLLIVSSCNKNFEKVLEDQNYKDSATLAFGKPKVLYIVVDGARGRSIREGNTPNIKSLLPHSVYSWESLADVDLYEKPNNWADMLTGVKKEKHHVLSETFANNDLARYPVIFKRVKDNKASAKIVSFSTSALLNNNLTNGVDTKVLLSDDDQVKTEVVNNLKTDTASFIFAHFSAVDKAGSQPGSTYDLSSTAYKAAIEKFDSSVGEMIAALRSRRDFALENWLVVISSTNGGAFTLPDNENDKTIFSNTSANTFVLYYSPKYNSKIISKPFTGNRYLGKTVRFKGGATGVNASVPNGAFTYYDFPDSVDFTIELKVKKNDPLNNGSYTFDKFPAILAKTTKWPTDAGWAIFFEGTYWQFSVFGNVPRKQQRGGNLGKGVWNTLTVKVERRSGKKYLRTYTDGVYYGETDITDVGDIKSTDPLRLGFIPSSGQGEPDVQVSDIRIFRSSVPDNIISRYVCETYIDQNHPNYSSLVGYWPVTDGNGGRIADVSPWENHFLLTGPYQWIDFNDLVCSPAITDLAKQVPQNSDIPGQIFSWLRIPVLGSWGLDGRVWIDR
jgi:hypothetical protein